MVFMKDFDCDFSVSVEEYVEFIDENVDVLDINSLIENSWALRALANNRSFVLEHYHLELKNVWNGESINENLPQTIIIAQRPNFYVRTNIWLPLEGVGVQTEFQKSLYSYDLAHDHNFNFVTVGYFGPGYETDLFEYDYHRVQGYEGEVVELEEKGRHQLVPGRVMVYRAGKDIHIQRTPEQLSVSLNLMCRARETRYSQQYIFDVNEKKIVRGAGDLASSRLFLIDLMRHLHNDQTIDILTDFVTSHACPRSRAYALRVLKEICPEEMEYFNSKATSSIVALSNLPLVHGSGSRDYAGT